MKKIKDELEELQEEYETLDKEYIAYLEADMNRQAAIINRKKNKVADKIEFIKAQRAFEKEIKKIKEEEMYGIRQEMKKELKLYGQFIQSKGLVNEYENFKEEQEEEEEACEE